MIPYLRQFDFEYGKSAQVSPLIRRVVARNPGPFTFTGTGTYIVGHGEVAVIDPGPDLPEHLQAILAATAGETIAHILITHHHGDHWPLMVPLKAATGATIHGRPVAGLAAADEGGALAQGAFAPEVALLGGETVSGPGWTLEAIPTPGHTANHLCYALAEENACFTGDHVMGWSTTVIAPPDGDMGAYMESLERIRSRGFDTLWPTHGPPIRQVEPFVAAYVEHRRAREAQILAGLAAGPSTIGELVPRLYADVDPRLHPAAARSMLASLIDLVRRGRVACDGPPNEDSLYRLA